MGKCNLKVVWLFGALISAIGFYYMSLPPKRLYSFSVANLFTAMGLAMIQVTLMPIGATIVPPGQGGTINGIAVAFSASGRAVGPVMFGFMYDGLGRNVPWFVCAIMALSLIFLCLLIPIQVNTEPNSVELPIPESLRTLSAQGQIAPAMTFACRCSMSIATKGLPSRQSAPDLGGIEKAETRARSATANI